MELWQFNPSSIPLLIAAALMISVALYAMQSRRLSGVNPFIVLVLASAVWLLGYMMELGARTVEVGMFWVKVEYVAISFLPTAWLVFTFHYTNRSELLTPLRLTLLCLIPVLTLLTVWTNESHHLFYTRVSLDTAHAFPLLVLDHSLFFWLHTANSYLLLLLSTFLTLQVLWRSTGTYRSQAITLFIGAFAPLVGNLLTLFNFNPLAPLDLTPFAFTITGLALFWSLFRFRLLDLSPVARYAIIENLLDAILVVDARGRLVDLNPTALVLLNLDHDRVIGETATVALHHQPELAVLVRAPQATQLELSLLVNGDPRHYEVRLNPFKDKRGRLLGWLLILHDFTVRKQAQESLRLHEEELREQGRVLQLLNDITRTAVAQQDFNEMLRVLTDQLGRLINADGCYITLWDEIKQQSIPAAAYGGLHEHYRSLPPLPKGEPSMTEAVLREGRWLVAEDVFNSPYVSLLRARELPTRSLLGLPLIADGKKLGAVLLSFDQPHRFTPTEIERGEVAAAQIALAISKAQLYQTISDERSQLQSLIAASRDGIVLTSLERRMLVINEAALKMLGLSGMPADWAGQFMSEAIAQARHYAPDLVKTTLAEMRRIKRGDEPMSEGEYQILKRQIHWRNFPVVREGLPLGRLLVMRDVTDQHLLEKLRDDLTHTMVHDLRNPLTAIYSGLSILEMDLTFSGEQREVFVMIQRAAERLLGLINSILDVTRLENGQMPLNRQSVKLSDLAQEVMQIETPLATKKQIELILALIPNLPPLNVDVNFIQRVLQNLIGNAIKFTPSGGTITVRAEGEKECWVVVTVQDSGGGIPPEIQSRLFQKFVTGRQAERGSGLGLTFCKLAVEAHGGRIWVESQLGMGTTFKFTLPTASAN